MTAVATPTRIKGRRTRFDLSATMAHLAASPGVRERAQAMS
jgi:hypothetical protein